MRKKKQSSLKFYLSLILLVIQAYQLIKTYQEDQDEVF